MKACIIKHTISKLATMSGTDLINNNEGVGVIVTEDLILFVV